MENKPIISFGSPPSNLHEWWLLMIDMPLFNNEKVVGFDYKWLPSDFEFPYFGISDI